MSARGEAVPPAAGPRAALGALGRGLTALHRSLVERARRDFEREQHALFGAGELLRLLTSDPHFAWLRSLSELIVDLDVFLEVAPGPGDDDAAAVRAEVERLISPDPNTEGSLGERYREYVLDDPAVAIAHAEVRQALLRLPDPRDVDEAAVLHARHQFREANRHRT
ncbi:MAG: hypothetical protein JSS46_15215 [Proteobacteria bacterium]|nr:hypothetical protein [Pseudomonadota bacterium]